MKQLFDIEITAEANDKHRAGEPGVNRIEVMLIDFVKDLSENGYKVVLAQIARPRRGAPADEPVRTKNILAGIKKATLPTK